MKESLKRTFREPELVVYGEMVTLTSAVMGNRQSDGDTHPVKNKTS